MRRWLKSFGYAWSGILFLFRTERNAQIEGVIGLIAISLGLALGITKTEWLIIALCIMAVLSLEAMNTALEKIIDHLHPEIHPAIGLAKDLLAGAVLIASIGAAIIGIAIFYPYLF